MPRDERRGVGGLGHALGHGEVVLDPFRGEVRWHFLRRNVLIRVKDDAGAAVEREAGRR